MISQIIKSMIFNIADYSNKLNDYNVITGVNSDSGSILLTCEDDIDSNLLEGNYILITGALFKNELESLTAVTGGYLVETTVNHDLTEDFQTTINLVGFGGSWDDTFVIASINGPKTFTITTSLSSPAGTAYLLENRYGSIRGFQIITAIDGKTLTFASDTSFLLYDLTNAKINYNYRITSVFDDEAAIAHYNANSTTDKAWAYILYDGTIASKDVNIDSDSIAKMSRVDAISQEIIIGFSILVIEGSSNYNTSQVVQNSLINFRYPILKSIYGLQINFDNYLNADRQGVVFLGDSAASYKGGIYLHIYNFQTQLYLTVYETIENNASAAMRSIDLSLLLEYDDYTNTKKEVKIILPE